MDSQFKIPMTNRSGVFAIVDEDTYQWALGFRWHLDKHGYAQTSVRREPGSDRFTKKFMHRLIMSEPKGLVIDHLNFNRLDNRKSNLRACTAAENNLRTCPINQRVLFPKGPLMPILTPQEAMAKRAKVGVREKYPGRWVARFSVGGKEYHVGTFDSFDVAFEAAVKKRELYFSESIRVGA